MSAHRDTNSGTHADPHIGSTLPLPHLGSHTTGTVTHLRWSPSLGQILTIRRHDDRASVPLLLYGDRLTDALAARDRRAA